MASSIHFPASNEPDKKRKVLRLRVDEEFSPELSNRIRNLSSAEILDLINVESYESLKLLSKESRRSINAQVVSMLSDKLSLLPPAQTELLGDRFATYRGGKGDFFHDLFPYIEAFSPQFVESLIGRYCPDAESILDPFGGTGTSGITFTNTESSAKAFFCEVNPLLQRICGLKSQVRSLESGVRAGLREKLVSFARSLNETIDSCEEDPDLSVSYSMVFKDSNMFSRSTLKQILKTRSCLDRLSASDTNVASCLELATLVSIVPASEMQRAGDLRRKRASERARVSSNLYEHISKNLLKIAEGIDEFETSKNEPVFISENAKSLQAIPHLGVDAVITSPPYLNGTNYIRNTKLELWFLRVLRNSADMARLRDSTITAGINDVRGEKSKRPNLTIEFESLLKCLDQLDESAYDVRIPKMVRLYGQDMFEALEGAIKHVREGGLIAIDIGDSIYSGVRVPTDELIVEILEKLGCSIEQKIHLRERLSRGGKKAHQFCIVARKSSTTTKEAPLSLNLEAWEKFLVDMPHQSPPFNKRNWGHPNHSLCSYQGKLKPSIAHWIVNSMFTEGDRILDPFSGVGTIPFEAALMGCESFGLDLSPAAFAISSAKLQKPDKTSLLTSLDELQEFIDTEKNTLAETWLPSFNKPLQEYYQEDTFKEILAARKWFESRKPWSVDECLLLACSMHILHGNRPYALSRRSHPVTPFAPTGDFLYKSFVEKLGEKLSRTISADLDDRFVTGKVYEADATKTWPYEIDKLDGVVTSPPFFDSTRFYLANWIRMWFAGWGKFEFKSGKNAFVEERQKLNFSVYDPILRQSKERLNQGGFLLFHLGKSKKCDMAEEIGRRSKYWFANSELFLESVGHCESHGIRDKGTVTDHQYLLLY